MNIMLLYATETSYRLTSCNR